MHDDAQRARGTVRRLGLERWQLTLARRSAESRATIPDLQLEVEVEARALCLACQHAGASWTAGLVRACARALREHPLANGAYRDGAAELHERVNVGVLMTEGARQVIVTLFDADAKGLETLESELNDLRAGAAAGTLRAPALSGATFTLWDLQPLAIDRATPLVWPGQAAALAVGAVRQVARVRAGSIVPASVVTATLASDHRILYGTEAAAFLLSIKRHLEEESQ